MNKKTLQKEVYFASLIRLSNCENKLGRTFMKFALNVEKTYS